MAHQRVRWSLGNEESAACSSNWLPRPSTKGRGCGHTTPIAKLMMKASMAASAARNAARRQGPGPSSHAATSPHGTAQIRYSAKKNALVTSAGRAGRLALIMRKSVVLRCST